MFSSRISLIIESMRPAQWMKNSLIFVALIFSKNLLVPEAAVKTLAAFLIFSLVSGCGYIINDIVDVEKDRAHPVKKNRPIASGRLGVGAAWSFIGVVVIASFTAAFLINPSFGFITAAHFVLFNLYTFFLKAVPIVDILTIATGFVIRAVAGALVIEVEISSWLLLCTMLLALFVVIGKRRHEILLLGDSAVSHRAVLHEYNTTLLDQMVAVVTASTLLAYSFYTISAETVAKFGTENLKYTIIFVLYGIFRYLYIIYRKEGGGRPEKDILTDVPTIINLLLWGAAVVTILYIG